MTQTPEFVGAHPIFAQTIRSRWSALWMMNYRSDGRSRTYNQARSVELITPATFAAAGHALEAELALHVVGLVDELQRLRPDLPPDMASWVLLESGSFDFSRLAAMAGTDLTRLQEQKLSVDAATRILDTLEGRTTDEPDTRWTVRGDGSMLSLDEGASAPYHGLPGGAFLSPELLTDLLGPFGAHLDLNLTRLSDREVPAGPTYATYEGSGSLVLTSGEGGPDIHLALAGVEVWIDVTEPGQTFLHRLAFTAPSSPQILEGRRHFEGVAWEDDLRLDILYLAVRAE
jgi:hypothetical protein